MLRRLGRNCLLMLLSGPAAAQTAIDLQSILTRVERVEAENKRLSSEIADLRKELANARDREDSTLPAPQPPNSAGTDERLAVLESRTAELDQKKIESSQKMPVQLTGMLLFNTFANGSDGGAGLPDPITASATAARRYDGATLRQTVLGLKFFGPRLPGDGTVSGSVYMDFLGGGTQPLNNLFRLRIATIDLAWKNTTIAVGQDKPIIAPREPTSLAQVGVSPLTGAGNLWQWQPQARIEQRFKAGERSQVNVQAGVFESDETATAVPAQYAGSLEQWRPAYEGRAEFVYAGSGQAADQRRFELAAGYHGSATRVADQSVASRVASLDWLARPVSWLDFRGAWFTGRNVAGLGALRQGFTILPSGQAIPVHSDGGWGEITLTASPRWSFHLFSGEEIDRARDLSANGISRNILYGGNVMWKIAPNILAAFETTHLRTMYLLSGPRLNNHYDLALAYLF